MNKKLCMTNGTWHNFIQGSYILLASSKIDLKKKMSSMVHNDQIERTRLHAPSANDVISSKRAFPAFEDFSVLLVIP